MLTNRGATESGSMTVISANGDKVVVPVHLLDDLIRQNKIVAFLRSDGWAVIGRDPIRKIQPPVPGTGDRQGGFVFKRPRY